MNSSRGASKVWGVRRRLDHLPERSYSVHQTCRWPTLLPYQLLEQKGSQTSYVSKRPTFKTDEEIRRAYQISQQYTSFILISWTTLIIFICNNNLGNVEPILRCIAACYFTNAAYLHISGEYRTVLADVVLHVHPHSVLYTEVKAPWYFSFFEIIEFGRC